MEENLAGHLAFGWDGSETRTVLIGGRIVYQDRAFPFDAAAIAAQSREQARLLWQRMNDL